MKGKKTASNKPQTLEDTFARSKESARRGSAAARIVKITGVALAGTALAGMSFSASFAADQTSSSSSSSSAGASPATSKANVNSSLAYSQASSASEKNETVYVFSKADGSIKNVTVSSELKNADGAAMLRDSSNLSNIKNVESDGEFSQTAEGIVWDAQGENVYYQGDSSAKPPVDIKVSYTLDGTAVNPEELAGKSGHVKIRYDYSNSSKQGSTYTPFVALTALIMKNDNFKNVKVTNGKAIDDGDRTIIAGFAMPGLDEDLGSIGGEIDIPTYVEIEADATNFALDSTFTVVTSDIFNDIDTNFDSGDINSSINALSTAAQKLVDGSSQLADGLNALDTGAGKLADGTDTLAGQTKQLPKQTSQLNAGAQQLSMGLNKAAENLKEKDVAGGVKTMYAGSKALGEGMEKLDDVLELSENYLADALKDLNSEQIKKDMQDVSEAAQNYKTAYTAVVKAGKGSDVNTIHTSLTPLFTQLEENAALLEKISEQTEKLSASAQDSATNAQSSVEDAEKALSSMSTKGMTKEQKAAIASAKKKLSAASDDMKDAKASIKALSTLSDDIDDAASNAQDTSQSVGDTQTKLRAQADVMTDYLKAASALGVAAGALEADAKTVGTNDISQAIINIEASKGFLGAARGDKGLKALEAGNAQVTGGLNELSSGIDEVIGGFTNANTGASQLAAGTKKLADGTPKLTEGISQLNDGASELADGTTAASEGMKALAEGMEQFNKQGIQKLVSVYKNDIAGLGDRVKATVQAGKDYTNFSGIEQGTSGQVKFIYETDAI